MIGAFCIMSALAFMLICFIWTKDTFLNILIKMFFGTMTVWSIVCALLYFGFHS